MGRILSFITGNPTWAIWGTVIIAVCSLAGGVYLGYKITDNSWKAKEVDLLKKQMEEKDKWESLAGALVKQNLVLEAKRRDLYVLLQEKKHEVTDGRICFADANALSVWNSALAADPVSDASGGKPPVGAGPFKGVTDEEVLNNQIINAERWAKCRADLNTYLDWRDEYIKGRK